MINNKANKCLCNNNNSNKTNKSNNTHKNKQHNKKTINQICLLI